MTRKTTTPYANPAANHCRLRMLTRDAVITNIAAINIDMAHCRSNPNDSASMPRSKDALPKMPLAIAFKITAILAALIRAAAPISGSLIVNTLGDMLDRQEPLGEYFLVPAVRY